jgi:Rnl2 family RNA ligase
MEPEAKFREYPSIELHTRGNFVELLKSKYADPSILWVASEKIHGSNFSVFCDGKIVKYGRRNDFITKEIPIKEEKVDTYFLENFYDARNLVGKFHNKLGELFEDLKQRYKEIVSFTLYGEYFGGNWINKDLAKQKPVQTGITYTPRHEYFVFDCNVKTSTGDEWVPALDLEKFIGKYITTVPIYCKGSFEEVFAVNTKIDSTVPEILGFEKVEKNLIEGMVLRPNETFFIDDQRVMLKKKNAEFQEKGPVEVAPKKAAKKEEK